MGGNSLRVVLSNHDDVHIVGDSDVINPVTILGVLSGLNQCHTGRRVAVGRASVGNEGDTANEGQGSRGTGGAVGDFAFIPAEG